jgi:hypothetical protein
VDLSVEDVRVNEQVSAEGERCHRLDIFVEDLGIKDVRVDEQNSAQLGLVPVSMNSPATFFVTVHRICRV